MSVSHPAAEFIRLLTGDADTPCTVQWFEDHPSRPIEARHRHGTISKALPKLLALNGEGAGIFVTINATNGGRYAADVTELRALFVDGDGVAQPDFWALPPTILQQREATKWHAFWRLLPGEDRRRFKAAQLALAKVYGSDARVHDLSRVMRLPGFLHQKDPDFPGVYAIIESGASAYTIDVILAAHGIDPASVTAEPEVAAVAMAAFDGHEIDATERAALIAALPRDPNGRHHAAMAWTVNAVGACMPAEEIAELLSSWFVSHGRTPQTREVANLIRDARAALTSGRMHLSLPGIRADLSFPVAPGGGAVGPALPPEAAAAQVAELTDWRVEILRNKDHTWRSHVRNVELILSHDSRVSRCFRYNLFSNAVEVTKPPWRKWAAGGAAWTDDDAVAFAQWAARAFDEKPALEPGIVHVAVRPYARQHSYHPVRDYLAALTWDGVPRLATWLHTYLGAADTPYTRAVGLRFLVGAVARVMQPGCKLDTMLVLEGRQGIGKSSAVRALFNGWYTDAELDVSNKDTSAIIRGHWGVEFGEMHAANRAEVNQLKAFLSRREDRQRDAYARTPETHPRQCVFVGSTNRDAYLLDTTGGRRFWPLACGRIRLEGAEGLLAGRDALWAEAFALHERGEPWWLTAEEEVPAAAEQHARQLRDEGEDAVSAWLSTPDNFDVSATSLYQGVTGAEVWLGALGGSVLTFNRAAQSRVADCMRSLGFIRKAFWRNGKTMKGYVREQNTVPEGGRG